MVSRAKRFLDANQAVAIEASIAASESKSRGELVVCLASRSLDSARAEVLAAMATGLAAVTGVWLLAQKVQVSEAGPVLRLELPALLALFVAGSALGYALVRFLPLLGVWFSTATQRRRHVERRAAIAFHEEGIRGTPDGTGILIYVSILERIAHVMADSSAARAIPPDDWSHLEEIVATAFAQRRGSDGVLRAVEYAGELLEEHLPGSSEGGTLANHVRFL